MTKNSLHKQLELTEEENPYAIMPRANDDRYLDHTYAVLHKVFEADAATQLRKLADKVYVKRKRDSSNWP
jgi:hypothetical protein